MGFIRLQTKTKNGKKYQYVYYRITRRSRKKDGGDGQPKTIDRLIGHDTIFGNYLHYWLWEGIPAADYAEAFVSFEMKKYPSLYRGIRWQIDWQFKKGKAIAGKLKFRGTPNLDPECPINVDARSKWPRMRRRFLQAYINRIFEKSTAITKEIEAIAYHLAKYEQHQQLLIQEKARYQEWQKDPDREWWEGNTHYTYHPDYGDQTLENIEICQHNIDYWWESYQTEIAKLLDMAPPKQREGFKAAIIRQAEKLSKSPNYIDRYDCK
jgi:hypothetical protein